MFRTLLQKDGLRVGLLKKMASSGYDGDGSCENLTLGKKKQGAATTPPRTEAERRSKKLDLIQLRDVPGIQHVIYAHNLRPVDVQGCTSPLVLSPKCGTKVDHSVAPPNGLTRLVLPPSEDNSSEVTARSPSRSASTPEKQCLRFDDEVPDAENVSCISWHCLCSSGKHSKHKEQQQQRKGTSCKPTARPQQSNGIVKNSHDMTLESLQYSALPGLHSRPHCCLSRTQCVVHPPSINYHCRDGVHIKSPGSGMLASPQHHNYFQFEYAYPSPDLSSQALDELSQQMAPQSMDSAATTQQNKHPSAVRLGKCILKFGKKAPACIRDPGSFSNPTSVDAFPNGDAAVLDSDNYTLQLFTHTGHCKKVYQFRRKIVDVVVLDHSSVALLREKDLGVFNIQEHAVRDVNLLDCSNPVAMAKIQHSRYNVNYVVAMPTYINIYKGNGEIFKKIQSHSTEKGSTKLKYHLVRITDVAIHKRTKDIFVLDGGSRNIYVFSSKGNYKYTIDTTKFAVGAFSGHGKLSIDGAGNIVIADSKNHRLLHYNSQDGATCLIVYNRDYVPTGVLVTEDNRLMTTIDSTGRSFAGVRVYNYKQ